jgi:Fe-S-cluster-containing hydrogenase component 2
MQKAIVAPSACRPAACPTCLARQVCPTKAILRLDYDEPVAVNHTLCRGCGKCVTVCPWQAIEVSDQ